jgi:hypothetical protein
MIMISTVDREAKGPSSSGGTGRGNSLVSIFKFWCL